MKKLLVIIFLLLMLIPAGGYSMGKTIPGRDDLFEELVIAVGAKQSAQFVFGDNIAGYFEGFTNSYKKGGGYLMKSFPVYADFGSYNAGGLNNKREAQSTKIYPYGVRSIYNNGIWDEFMVFSKKYAVAISVHSNAKQKLSLFPIFNLAENDTNIEEKDGVISLSPKEARNTDYPAYVAIASVTPYTYENADPARRPEITSIMKQTGGNVKPFFTTKNKEHDFTLYIAFDFSRDGAFQKAKELAARNYVEIHKDNVYQFLTRSYLRTDDPEYNRALMWAKLSSRFMVVEEFGKGIWAGLPWFKDNWGRDTFISFPGALLVNGEFGDAKEVMVNFAKFQNKDANDKNYGRVPNRVRGAQDIIYNTADGTPWFIREIHEYLQYTGDTDFAREIYPVVKTAISGAIANYVDVNGFLTHDDADTWMDARINGGPAWSPRGNRANDIQVLWYNALRIGSFLASQNGDPQSAEAWNRLSGKLKANFPKFFWNDKQKIMADRILVDDSADYRVRPNQLMLISVPLEDRFIPNDLEALVVKNAVSELLYPYGIASLSQNDPYFHPYHDYQSNYHKDAAYHNGTVWGWNAGFTVTALNRYGYTGLAYELSKNLAAQILNMGCRGAMSELIDAIPDTKGQVTLSGTYAQTWSTAEYARNGYQDYGGFRPNLLQRTVTLMPAVPEAWHSYTSAFAFGKNGKFRVDYRRNGENATFVIGYQGYDAPLDLIFVPAVASGAKYQVKVPLTAGAKVTLQVNVKNGAILVNGKAAAKEVYLHSYQHIIGNLKFQTPEIKPSVKAHLIKDFLKTIIESGKYEIKKK